MIIQSLTMNHFRQYYGEQTIDFAQSNGQQVVTVILGENGRGKTGIYRAVMLALFGDYKLDQDSREADIYLANINAVEEMRKKGTGINCSVHLSFIHKNELHEIKRTYFAMKQEDGKQKEQLLRASLINKTTGESWSNEKDIQAVIREIIDERVKHYFFFDGERIERLTRVSPLQKEEVTLGIKNLLKIDQVLKSKDVLTNVLSNVNNELENHSSGDYKKALQKMAQLEEHLKSLVKDEQKLESQKKANSHRLLEIDEALQSYDSMKSDMAVRDRLEMEIDKIQKTINRNFDQIKDLNKYLPLMVGEDVYHQELIKLSNQLTDGIEVGISLDFVNSILSDLRCICGTNFGNESIEHEQLSSLAESVSRYEENRDLYEIKNELERLISYIEGRENQIQQLLSDLERLITEKEENQWKLEEINKLVSISSEDNIRVLNEERMKLVTEDVNIDHQEQLNQEQQKKYNEKINKHTFILKSLQEKSGLHQQLLKKHKVLTDSKDAIIDVINKFEKDLIDELEVATMQNLSYLLDNSGQLIIRNVQIKPDYTLEVLNNYGQPFLANISQGQRQVLSLSFITGLAQVAGGKATLEMPLFMDTPFGRLSGQHQENLVEYLPEICSQWVLLVTDKEFGTVERTKFMETGNIGRFYELVSEDAGITKVQEVQLNDKGEVVPHA